MAHLAGASVSYGHISSSWFFIGLANQRIIIIYTYSREPGPTSVKMLSNLRNISIQHCTDPQFGPNTSCFKMEPAALLLSILHTYVRIALAFTALSPN